MNTSLLYHRFKMYGMQYVSCEYNGTTTIIRLQANKPLCRCPRCFSRHIVKNGVRERTFIGVPIGLSKTLFKVPLQRYVCRDCGYDQQEPIHFAKGSHSYTHAFATLVIELLKTGTIKDVAAHLSVSWDMVKDYATPQNQTSISLN